MGEMTKVTIGEEDFALRPFKAYKALVFGELISRVGDEVRELMGELAMYDRDYRQTHMVRFTKAQAIDRGWTIGEGGIPESSFVTPEGGGEPYIDMPRKPSEEERLMFVFPRAFKVAGSEVTRALGLLVIPDNELRAVHRQGEEALNTALDNLGERILDGEVGEIVELLAAAIDHLQDQLSGHEAAVGKIKGFLTRSTATADGEPDERNKTLTPMSVVGTVDDGSPSESPESSTPSQPPTDGTETASSSVPIGSSS